MPPLFLPLRQALKKRWINSESVRHAAAYAADSAIVITLKPSRMACLVYISIAAATGISLVSSALPWPIAIPALLWTLGAFLSAWRQTFQWQELYDEGTSWLLVDQHSSERVTRVESHFRSAYVVVLVFSTRSGVVRRACVWRDSVTPAAFSWLHARITLSSPDKEQSIVATSPHRRFTHPAGGTHRESTHFPRR